ncbi:MAG: hypothetical protein GY838_07995 [bacterium]|nr:hypothetical protein [bacterium]
MAGDKATIRFEGRDLICRTGTSIATALWEAGIRHLSHSPKYGRPRGVTCARGQCTACLMRVDGVPNVRVCETPLRDGMVVERQDAGAFYGAPMQKMLAVGGDLVPVGFYYKWFTKPAILSRVFLSAIRPLTGVGRLPERAEAEAEPATDLGRIPTVVVGAGPAGLSAALTSDGPVVLVDENDAPGGLRLAALDEAAAAGCLDGFAGLTSARAGLNHLAEGVAAADVDLRTGVRVVAGYHPGGLVLRHGAELATLACDRLVWAAGALDAPGLFPGNDVPGVLGTRALLRLLVRDGLDVTGRTILLVGGGQDLWLAAALLETRGAHPSILLESDDNGTDLATAVARRWPLHTGLVLDRAHTAADGSGLRAEFVPGPGPGGGGRLTLDADLVVVCRRAKPIYDIPYQLGVDLHLAPEQGGFVPRGCTGSGWSTTVPNGPEVTFVGEAAGETPETVLAGAGEAS